MKTHFSILISAVIALLIDTLLYYILPLEKSQFIYLITTVVILSLLSSGFTEFLKNSIAKGIKSLKQFIITSTLLTITFFLLFLYFYSRDAANFDFRFAFLLLGNFFIIKTAFVSVIMKLR